MSQLTDNLNLIVSIKSDIKSAIENKGVDMTGVSFGSFADKIGEITTSFVTVPLSVSVNGTYTPGQGVDGYSPVEVDVQPELQNKTVVENGEYIADQGYYGLGTVTVSVPSPQFVTETLNVSVNGTYNPGEGVDGYSQVVVDVPQSVTGYTEKDVTEKNINIVNLNNSASFVAPAAFYGNSYIETVDLPNCLYLGSHRTWTTELLFFANCSHLREVSLPLCSTILNSAFQNCTSLTSVYIPACDFLGNVCFNGCTGLTSISLPACKDIGQYCFNGCTGLTSISLPACKEIKAYCFNGCTGLTSISLPACSVLYTSCFYNCINLTEVTLASTSVCKMSVSPIQGTVFKKTPIESGTGSIYVPASLVDAYKSAPVWSQHSSQIFPIE